MGVGVGETDVGVGCGVDVDVGVGGTDVDVGGMIGGLTRTKVNSELAIALPSTLRYDQRFAPGGAHPYIV